MITTNVTVVSAETFSRFMQARNRILKNKILCFGDLIFIGLQSRNQVCRAVRRSHSHR